MCVSEAALVLSVEEDEAALGDFRGSPRRVPLILITSAGEKVVPGDWLLVHTGLAVARISAAEAADYQALRQRGVDHV
jgi:hydrogenase expression/formation protein HypC